MCECCKLIKELCNTVLSVFIDFCKVKILSQLNFKLHEKIHFTHHHDCYD
jgi:hypothetical protein